MSFRRRMVLLAAGAVAASVAMASVVVYVVTRSDLRGQVDSALKDMVPGVGSKPVRVVQGQDPLVGQRLSRPVDGGRVNARDAGKQRQAPELAFANPPLGAGDIRVEQVQIRGTRPAGGRGQTVSTQIILPKGKFGATVGYAQLLTAKGQVVLPVPGGPRLPIDAATRAVAAGRGPAFFRDVRVADTHLRVYTARAPDGGGLMVVRQLTDVDTTMRHLMLVLVIVSGAGILLAGALGLVVSRTALAPVRRLTRAAEEVASTQDLTRRIPAGDGDELDRLAASFNTMLAALDSSRESQRQLVSDASHELRTPLTSVRANLDALALDRGLTPGERARVVAATQAQLEELTVLVGDLVDLSKVGVDECETEDVRLDLAAAEAVARARLHAPACRFVLDAEPCLVRAAPARLHRAIVNLLDNAVKWGPVEGPIEVRVRDGCLSVRDHGPGIAPEDLPRVFDRFYRSPAARRLPGSGLGLAIVRQVAESHGGRVAAGNAPDGGALLTLELPSLAMTVEETTPVPELAAVHQLPPSL